MWHSQTHRGATLAGVGVHQITLLFSASFFEHFIALLIVFGGIDYLLCFDVVEYSVNLEVVRRLEAMHSHRCLWDISYTKYRNRELKTKTLLNALDQKFSVSVAEIEKNAHLRRRKQKIKHCEKWNLSSEVQLGWP